MTRVCVVGSGAREHALVSSLVSASEVVCTPGNPGIASIATCSPTVVDADLYVIGPEAPLVDGLADRLRASGHAVCGPGADGARLEGSKAWMKEVLVAAGVPTAGHAVFSEPAPAVEFLKSLPGPWVVKTDNLAGGKGVLVALDLDEAVDDACRKLRDGAVVIEEGLVGPELSVLAICDGERAVALPAAQDFKRVGDGDTGPNTGGMGAYSPVPFANSAVLDEVMERCVAPTLAALRARGIDYRGVLYAGLMLTPDGVKVIEYNVRFGDPEAEVVLPRVEDLLPWLEGAAAGHLPSSAVGVKPDALVTVVMASEGYPGQPRVGVSIRGVPDAPAMVFHAGTAMSDGRLVTAGGRVLAVTGSGPSVGAARDAAYAAVDQIHFDGAHWRTDIAAGVESGITAT
jgi:phosphoribosylamine--glycine ligase